MFNFLIKSPDSKTPYIISEGIKLLLPFVLLFIFLGFLYKGQIFNLKPTIFNTQGGADQRAHIAKIELVRQSFINKSSWPNWSNSFYLGYPPFGHYPPLFYSLGGLVAAVTSAAASYKVLTLFNYILSVLCFSFFVRRFTNLPKVWASWAGLFFALSSPILLSHLYGNEPNLLGWNITLLTFGLYCWPKKNYDIWLAAGLFALMIITHPYPVVFFGLSIITWSIFISYRNKNWRVQLWRLVKLFIPGILLTIWWWLPALLTIDYLSSLADPLDWRQYNFVYIIIVLIGTLFFLLKKNIKITQPPIIIIGLVWSIVLAFGGRNLIPFVGHFLHNSRFANLGIISFGLPVIFNTLYHYRQRIVGYKLVWFTTIAIGVMLVFITADSFRYGEFRLWLDKPVINLEQSQEFNELMNVLRDKRVIITPRLGGLSVSDSIVTYAPLYNWQSITGPYNQGDPKFFNYTVRLEWEERWAFNNQTLLNLMGSGAADFMFIRYLDFNIGDYDEFFRNKYGKLINNPQPNPRIALTTPALLVVPDDDVQLVTDTINLFLPQGYQLPMVSAQTVAKDEYKLFPIVVGTSYNIVSEYPNAKAYLIIAQSDEFIKNENPLVYNLPLNPSSFKKYFYQGSKYEYLKTVDTDIELYKRNSVDELLSLTKPAEEVWQKFKDSNLVVGEVQAKSSDMRIQISSLPKSFVIIRESWFPRWQVSGGKMWRTTQGFMLGYVESNQMEIKYLNAWEFFKAWASSKI